MTNMPPMQIRKIRNAIHEDIEYENSIATVRAINRIDTPIESGFIIMNIFIEIDRISNINEAVIYNNEDCTHSSNIKGLCALYTILYVILCPSSIDA